MAKDKDVDKYPQNPIERNLWLYCIAFRGGCGIAALIAACSLSLSSSILVISSLLVLLAGGDSAYKSSLYWMRKREQQMAALRRQQDAEQAQLERRRQTKAAQREASEKYFDPSMMTLGQARSAEAAAAPTGGQD